jgi:hypothetical protein
MRVKRLYQTYFLSCWQIGLVTMGAWLLGGCNFPSPDEDLPTCLPEELINPAIPLGPGDNEVIDTLSPTYIWDWGGGCNPQEFLLEVFNPTSDLPAMISVRVAGSSRGRASAGDLQPGSTYSWRVTPYTDGSPGPVSPANIFRTGPDCMDPFAAEYPAPMLLAPPDGTVISELSTAGGEPSVTFPLVWDDPSLCNPGGYEVQISTSPTFPAGRTHDVYPWVHETYLHFFFPPGLPEGLAMQDCTLYYWHVRAVLSDDEYGPWSEIWTILIQSNSMLCTTIPIVPPESPLVITPILPPMARGIQNTNCRSGPSGVFPIESTLFEGQSSRIIGRIENINWWLIEDPAVPDGCWVWGASVEVSGDMSLVPLVLSPPTPKAPNPPQQEQQGGQEEGGQEGCWIIDNQHPNGYCAPRACGPNDYPGGSCDP